MVTAKCLKCGGSAIANTYEQARKLINHAVGLSRGIKCGDSYNMVQEINSKVIAKEIPKPETPKPVVTNTSKPETPKPETTKPTSTTSKKTETSKETKKQNPPSDYSL